MRSVVALLFVSFASSANAALILCMPLSYKSDACLAKQTPNQSATTTQPTATTKSEPLQLKQSPSGLTEQQVQAIVTLLQAFGVDQVVVAQVEAILRGK